jgi:hypothetical protein
MRSLIFFILSMAFLAWAMSVGSLEKPSPKAAATHHVDFLAMACDAARQAIRSDMHAPEGATFGKCDAMVQTGVGPNRYAVAVAINLPHVDENGVAKPDTFYYVDTLFNPATNEMRTISLVHN